jgi:hypothetical protein
MGVIIKLLFFYPIGILSDMYPAYITIIASYGVRMAGIGMFLFLSEPNVYFYIVYAVIEMGQLMENIVLGSVY